MSLPNFGYWKVRLSLLWGGRMPRTRNLDQTWADTPNIHLCTLADFVDLAGESGAKIERAFALSESGRPKDMPPAAFTPHMLGGPNLLAPGAIFFLKKKS